MKMADPFYNAMSKENSDLEMQTTQFLLVEEKCVLGDLIRSKLEVLRSATTLGNQENCIILSGTS